MDYSALKDKDKEEICSILFDALMTKPFTGSVNQLVLQLLEVVRVPITIRDKVIVGILVSRDNYFIG